MNALARYISRVSALPCIPNADYAARLDRVGDDAVVVEADLDDVSGRGKSRLDPRPIARAPVQTNISRRLGGNLRRVRGASGSGSRHRGERRIIDGNQFGGVESLGAGLPNDQRDWLAGIADLIRGQYWLRSKSESLAGLNIGFPRGKQRLQSVGFRLLGTQHCEHTRHRLRRSYVNASDQRVRVRRAQHDGMRQSLENEIVEIAPAAGDKSKIFPAFGGVANNRMRRQRSRSPDSMRTRHEPAAAAISRNSSGNSRPPPIRSCPSFTSMSCTATRRNWGITAKPWPPYPSAI
jgi:hypothetical protein